MSPACSARAERTARATAWGSSRGAAMSRLVCRTAIGCRRPALSMSSACINSARRAPSAVADMAISRSSGLSARCRSRQKASARSDSIDLSWVSSRMTAATPSRPGSDCRRRTNNPSVTTSMRVAAETAASSRVRKPMVWPTLSPRNAAIRAAAARAARRRGSNITMRPSPRQGASSRASGTSVVLPAPGGATRTALRPAASVA